MSYWDFMEYGAWIIAALIFAWLLFDAVRVNKDFDEDLLTSSREGELEQVSEEHKL